MSYVVFAHQLRHHFSRFAGSIILFLFPKSAHTNLSLLVLLLRLFRLVLFGLFLFESVAYKFPMLLRVQIYFLTFL